MKFVGILLVVSLVVMFQSVAVLGQEETTMDPGMTTGAAGGSSDAADHTTADGSGGEPSTPAGGEGPTSLAPETVTGNSSSVLPAAWVILALAAASLFRTLGDGAVVKSY